MTSIFDNIKHINSYGQEYRQARQLAKVLNYSDFGNFENVIKKAEITCKSSGQDTAHHFGDITEMVELGSGSKRSFPSYTLSRYACYLIAMEADGSKPEVALAKAYFAIQTRKQEISEQYLEDKKSFISENKYLSITNPLQKLQNKLEYQIMEVL